MENTIETTLESLQLTVNFDQPLMELIDAGEYYPSIPSINRDFKNFPVQGSGQKEIEVFLLSTEDLFGRRTFATGNEVTNAMRGVTPEIKPAGLYPLLTLGARYPDQQKKTPIVAIGAICAGACVLRVPYLHYRNSWRGLSRAPYADGPDGVGWYEERFLAVRA